MYHKVKESTCHRIYVTKPSPKYCKNVKRSISPKPQILNQSLNPYPQNPNPHHPEEPNKNSESPRHKLLWTAYDNIYPCLNPKPPEQCLRVPLWKPIQLMEPARPPKANSLTLPVRVASMNAAPFHLVAVRQRVDDVIFQILPGVEGEVFSV